MKKERMVVEYHCDICGEKLPESYNRYRESGCFYAYDCVPLTFDICKSCAADARRIFNGECLQMTLKRVSVSDNASSSARDVTLEGDISRDKFIGEDVNLSRCIIL